MMRIDCPRLSGLAAAAILTCTFVSEALAQTQIHPSPGLGATNPVVIAVLADGYTSAQEKEFNADAANFFLSGLLQDEDFFRGTAGYMRIATKFESVATSGTSKYGFQMGVSDGACELTFPTDTIPIWTAAASVGAEYVVVIGNHPYSVGCTLGKIAYVSAGASGVKVLEHEFGHMLASLWDQFGIPANGTTPFPDVIDPSDKRNCARPPAHFGAGIAGCGLYNVGIERPNAMCRMGASHHPKFCTVCRTYLVNWFNDLPRPAGVSPVASHERTPQMGIVRASFQPAPGQPGQKPPATQPIVRLLLRFNPATGTAEPRRGFNSTGVYVPSHRRVGKYVYEILDNDKPGNNKIVDFGVLSDQLFQTRGYAGGVGEHGSAKANSTEVIVQIPGETVEGLRGATRNVSMVIWELLPGFPGFEINQGTFMKSQGNKEFMRQTQVISAAVLKKVLGEGGK